MRWIFKFIFITFLLLSNQLFAKIKLSLDRNEIRANETFQLTLEVEKQDTLANSQSLDFLPKEFQVLGSQHFQKSTVIDRQFANRMGWTITLVSNQSGIFTIPNFSIGNESSEPFSIQVFPMMDNLDELNPNSQIKISSQISNDTVYVQQQLIYTLRIYSSVQSRRHNLSPLVAENAIIKKLGEASEFQLFHDGSRYNVKEEKYVIFPQKSGELSIPPIKFRTNIVDPQASYGSLNRYRPIELSSKPFTVNVQPKPDTAALPWIPAKSLELTAQWQSSANNFEVGKPATLDFYIKGVALLPEQLPLIEFPEINGLKIYRDKPVLQNIINADGVNSYHLEKLAVIPNKAGQVTIPEIKIPFWNTTSNQQDFATLQSMDITVSESTEATTSLPSISQIEEPKLPEPANASPGQEAPVWQYLTIGFAALWVITLGLFLLRGPRNKTKVVKEVNKNNQQTETPLVIQKAAKQKDPKVMADAIIHWADMRAGHKVTNLNQLIKHCPDKQLQQELIKLQNALYAKDSFHSEWNGDLIFKQLVQVKFGANSFKSENEITPLYPR